MGKWTMIPGVPAIQLVLPPIMGRLVLVLAAWRFAYARETGFGGLFREGLGIPQVTLASAMAVVFALLTVRQFGPVLVSVAIALCVVAVIGTWASRRLEGGITGDVYGALCELTELSCLIGLLGYAQWVNG
jgi:adenosylcobinamide-GDP ribazoletransferase